MKILHLTDFHFSSQSRYKYDQQQMVSKIIESMNLKESIDLLIFSGDLVYAGTSIDEFEKADELLINKLAEHFSISRDRVIICPGNHDVNWSASSPAIEKFILDFKSNDEIDQFVQRNDGDYVKSLEILDGFYEYRDLFYLDEYRKNGDMIDKQFSVHQRDLGVFGRIGIVALNSAWRSINYDKTRFPEGESGQLIIPVVKLKDALGKLGSVDFKICIVHHPLNFLRRFNEWEIQDIIYREFNLLLTGHTHRSINSVNYHDKGGVIVIGSPATLADKSSELGINLITVDLKGHKVRLESRRLDHFSGGFNGVTLDQQLRLPLPKDKDRLSRIRRMVRNMFLKEQNEADGLFVASFGDNNAKSFGSLFTPPVLGHVSEYFEEVGNLSRPSQSEVNYSEIVKDVRDCLIFGGDKSGKTSLLKKIQLELLEGFESLGHLPFFIDCKEIDLARKQRDIHKEIKNYYGLFDKDLKLVSSAGKIVLLLDNFDPVVSSFAGKSIQDFLVSNKQVVLIGAVTIVKMIDPGPNQLFGRPIDKYFIHQIRRKEIRQLVGKWPNINSESRDEIVEKIFRLTKQMSIPFNYWTVSLFLWIFETTSDSNPRSDVQLIELYIERLLDKEAILFDKTRAFGFEKYKKFLAALAFELYRGHSKSNYHIKGSDLLKFAEDYVSQNPRNVVDPHSVIDYVRSKGILRFRENGSATFRLKGVFEYFLALQIQIDSEFRAEVLESPSSAAPFRNELEYYAGFSTGDSEFLKSILGLTKQVFSDSVKIRLGEFLNFDDVLKSVYTEADYRRMAKALGSPLQSFSKQELEVFSDELMEGATPTSELSVLTDVELEVKKPMEVAEYSLIENRETFLVLLCRVFRNQDEVRDRDLLSEVLDFVINAGITYGFFAHDELTRMISEKGAGKSGEVVIINWIIRIIPFLVTTILFEGMGHISIENLLEKKIKELSKTPDGNEYKIFILYMLQIDLAPSKYQKKIDELIQIIGLGALKASLLMKLQFYLIMKSNGNQAFEDFLKSKIRQIAKSISPNIDTNKMEEIQRAILLAERNKGEKL